MPTTPRHSVSTLIRPCTMLDQPTAELYRQWVHTEPRLTNTKMIAMTASTPPLWARMLNTPPDAPAAAAMKPPTHMATPLPIGKAAAVAIHASRGDFAQRVKSAVIVPESANRANTSHAVFERAGARSTPI